MIILNRFIVIKSALFGVSFLLAVFASAAHALTLKPIEVAPHIYAFIGDLGARTRENEGMNANTGFIVTSAGVVVVDSGPSYEVAKEIHAAIRTVSSLPVKFVINTGGQDHRWLGNSYFMEQGAQVVAARSALPDMQERGPAQLEALKVELKNKMKGTRIAFPTRLFDKSETLHVGSTDIRILHFYGGHTPGDSVVWLPDSGVLFSGDQIYVDRILGIFPFSSSKNWLMSFEQIERLKPRVIVPGHGNVCDLEKARRQTKDYLVLLSSHMRHALDQLVDLQTAIDSLDQSAFKGLRNYDALKGGNASRVYLEMEAE